MTDAYWMRRMERGPVRGSIEANDVGSGKTHIVLQCIAAAAAESGGDKVHWPTLLVMPNSLVSQTFSEARRFFGGLLDVLLFYDTQATAAADRRAHTIDRSRFGEVMDGLMRATDDPKVGSLSLFLSVSSSFSFSGGRVDLGPSMLMTGEIYVLGPRSTRRARSRSIVTSDK